MKKCNFCRKKGLITQKAAQRHTTINISGGDGIDTGNCNGNDNANSDRTTTTPV